MKSRSHMRDINSPRSRHTIVNTSFDVSVSCCLYVLTEATFKAQFM